MNYLAKLKAEFSERALPSACQKTPVFKSSAAPILPGATFFRDLFSGTTGFAVL